MDENNIHSCYEYKVIDNVSNSQTHYGTFCYPAIIITGKYYDIIVIIMIIIEKPNMTRDEEKWNKCFIQHIESIP